MTTRPYRTRQWLASTALSQRGGLLPFSADSIVAGEPRGWLSGKDRELEQTHGSHKAHSFFIRGETRCRHWSLVFVLILLATPVDLVSLWRLHIGAIIIMGESDLFPELGSLSPVLLETATA